MQTTDSKKIVKKPQYIRGIFNYCDRWCERCQFTSRCLSYTLEEKHSGSPEEIAQFNEELWDSFDEVLEETYSVVQEIALEYGFDPDSIIEMPDGIAEVENRNLAHLITHATDTYTKMVEEWFESCELYFKQKEEEMNLIRIVTPGHNPQKEAEIINDAAEAVRWYQYQIHIKIQRAIRSAAVEQQSEYDENIKNRAKDSDGSAKVAIIGIEGSIKAWKIFQNSCPELEKQIAELIVFLQSILKRVENQFPQARAFIRPGFDEIGVTDAQ